MANKDVQFPCNDFARLLNEYNCTLSMSRKGNCRDYAMAESFFKPIKEECFYKYILGNHSMLHKIKFTYIDGGYITVRIHTSLGGIAPLEAFKQKSLCAVA
ncbi:MAG TPA: IS3 family transposase [Saprospiraceae bacterium]|nr:IS3 family transposase [Saprospiraceae bacterium]